MALTKIITDTIDLSSDTTALKMPKGTTSDVRLSPVVTYLVVAGGGGGGGYSNAGGGGGGGLLTNYGTSTLSLDTDVAYTVTIGAGGAGGANSDGAVAGQGGNSKFDTIESTGGGGGTAVAGSSGQPGGSGGSGGGGGYMTNQPGGTASPAGQGNPGGAGGGAGGYYPGGGGGGAGAAGVTPANNTSYGNGGDGLEVNIIGGTGNYYAGGGGGGVGGGPVSPPSGPGGAGGTGGGGQGRNDDHLGTKVPATAGTDGLGGGGGGASGTDVVSGGSGVVIIRYSASFSGKVTLSGITGVVDQAVSGSSDLYAKATGVGTGTITFAGSTATIGTMRENTTTGKMEIYTGATGWRALQQTGQDVGVVPSDNFNTVKYTGNSGTQIITGFNFKPSFIWIKRISSPAEDHAIYDTIRGINEQLSSNTENAEATNTAPYEGVTSFNNDGFTAGDNGGTNRSPYDYVSWGWKASDAVSYPAVGSGSGSQLASAGYTNTAAGFSMVKYTGVISSKDTREVQHGLGGVPEIIISKEINRASTRWVVRTQLIDDSPYSYLVLSGTDALQQFNGSVDGTLNLPTASVFDINWNTSVGTNGYDIIAYCFRSIPGYSLMGTYTGTGSATNFPIIYTGFEPAWILIKRTDTTANWRILDNKRSTTNPINKELYPNLSNAEGTFTALNFYNNGFQLINTDASYNAAGGTYIFMCFAS